MRIYYQVPYNNLSNAYTFPNYPHKTKGDACSTSSMLFSVILYFDPFNFHNVILFPMPLYILYLGNILRFM